MQVARFIESRVLQGLARVCACVYLPIHSPDEEELASKVEGANEIVPPVIEQEWQADHNLHNHQSKYPL